ncbi:DUF3742 family protein [Pseudomonas oryzihabitans]|uniref:DUF3742 family protein n=1 Tax=Pseudomonas oryzihabitans TaxID=47885 RepID=UPI003917382F
MSFHHYMSVRGLEVMATSNAIPAQIGHAIGRLLSAVLIAEAAVWRVAKKTGLPVFVIGALRWIVRALAIAFMAYTSLYLLLPALIVIGVGLVFSKLPAGTTELFSSHVYRDGTEGHGYYCEVSGRRIS